MQTLNQPGMSSAISTLDRRPWRVLVLLTVILALLGVATASASPAHFHAKTATGCDLCLSAGLLASGHVAHVQSLAAPRSGGFLDVATAGITYSLLRYQATHTRGPPANTL